jgi:hypothetical protein
VPTAPEVLEHSSSRNTTAAATAEPKKAAGGKVKLAKQASTAAGKIPRPGENGAAVGACCHYNGNKIYISTQDINIPILYRITCCIVCVARPFQTWLGIPTVTVCCCQGHLLQVVKQQGSQRPVHLLRQSLPHQPVL